LLLIAPLLGFAPQEKPARPNFVIMMCDDQRWECDVRSRAIRSEDAQHGRIGREGIVFKNAFVVNSLCGPESRVDPDRDVLAHERRARQ